MATTTLPRSYIIERIDARLASLRSQQDADTPVAAAGDVAARQAWVDYAGQVRLLALNIAEQAEGVQNAAGANGPSAAEVEQALEGIDLKFPSSPRWGRTVSPGLNATISEGKAAGQRLTEARREVNALEHARAYLLDTPVEAFSMTALERLNLLSVIKFRLA